ncbi:hypothetical protein F5Y17DRAFT_433430 [Xylariaceae sp. FL0594]|nr:hypothetical protein F5Y17DRAFT_433430 [Xylariaceae sp. FL0594]
MSRKLGTSSYNQYVAGAFISSKPLVSLLRVCRAIEPRQKPSYSSKQPRNAWNKIHWRKPKPQQKAISYRRLHTPNPKKNMAPTSKGKGANPAPNYLVSMNRVQTQLEAQLKVVRSFMPTTSSLSASFKSSTSSLSASSTSSSKPSFSALASGTTNINNNNNTNPTANGSRKDRHARNDAAEESLFQESRAQDPNAGLGYSTSKPTKEKEREQERGTHLLRGRLLGKRRSAGDDFGNKRRRATIAGESNSSSSDDEPGRSGLGRAKKRVRRDVDVEQERRPGYDSETIPPTTTTNTTEAARAEAVDEDEMDVEKNGQTATAATPGPGGEADSIKSKRKKKKKRRNNNNKKKKKSKTTTDQEANGTETGNGAEERGEVDS